MILIDSQSLTVLNKAGFIHQDCLLELLADGSDATSETSGGGSGGSIFLVTETLAFHGYAHANGGNVLDAWMRDG